MRRGLVVAILVLGFCSPAHQVVADHWHERSLECEGALALRDLAKDAIPQLEAAGVSSRNWRHVLRLAKLRAARECAPWLHVEKKPPTIASPIDLDWLDEVISGLDEPPPERVELGVDCTEPFTVSLPDDVLTECERPGKHSP